MPSLFHVACLASGLLVLSSVTNGSPTPKASADIVGLEPIINPVVDAYADCDGAQTSKLQQAVRDAATLAAYTQNPAIDQTTPAYTHYLRAADAANANALWGVLAKANSDTFHLSFTCSDGKDQTVCPQNSLANTDASPQAPGKVAVITICPPFFTSPETAKSLSTKQFIKNPNRKQSPTSWCAPGQKFSDFETAGHTILHEMSHLNAVGVAAKVPEGNGGSHGTDDVAGLGNAYQPAALKLKSLWDKGQTNLLPPWQNAESIAASATEWYFQNQCDFPEISS